MKAMTTIGMAALLTAVLAGCASTGAGSHPPIDDRTLDARIIPGATTRGDIASSFGNASVIRFTSGYEVWIYKDTTGAPRFLRYVPVVGLGAGLIQDRKRELVILFGPDGIVRKHRLLVQSADS